MSVCTGYEPACLSCAEQVQDDPLLLQAARRAAVHIVPVHGPCGRQRAVRHSHEDPWVRLQQQPACSAGRLSLVGLALAALAAWKRWGRVAKDLALSWEPPIVRNTALLSLWCLPAPLEKMNNGCAAHVTLYVCRIQIAEGALGGVPPARDCICGGAPRRRRCAFGVLLQACGFVLGAHRPQI